LGRKGTGCSATNSSEIRQERDRKKGGKETVLKRSTEGDPEETPPRSCHKKKKSARDTCGKAYRDPGKGRNPGECNLRYLGAWKGGGDRSLRSPNRDAETTASRTGSVRVLGISYALKYRTPKKTRPRDSSTQSKAEKQVLD